MKTLYHGGDSIIKNPEIRESTRTLDFGKGFYLTSSEKQASDWVIRKLERIGQKKGFVNLYDFLEEDAKSNLNVKVFKNPSDEWLDFVMSNRQIPYFTHDFDIVIGPVANDRVYTAFALFEGGSISRETLISELKTYRLVDQYLFHTEQAFKYLVFKAANTIEYDK